jgi:aminocarboxymuconate-semialdehyde decarboxylase
MKIDVHSHIELPEAVASLPEKLRTPSLSFLSPESKSYQERITEALRDQLENPERRIADMKQMGLDLTVLSIAPPHFFYNLDGEVTVDLSRRQNNRLSEIVRAYPAKFVGMATVPLQNVEAAVAELERAILNLGLKGVEVGSNIRGRYLGDQIFWPFYETAAHLDIPIFIHPRDVAGTDRMKDFYFPNLIGNPLDTTIAAAHIIFSGVLDRFPRLKIILAHAGGQLPYICGRLGHGFEVRPECKELIKRSPLDYVNRFYFDTIAHDTDSLRFLISRAGADRVVMGTDYPYDMGDMDPVRTVGKLTELPEDQKSKILGENAVSLFKIS